MLPSHYLIGISPPEGRARLSFAFDYLLVLVQQSCQPIGFLYACVQLSIFPGKVISLPLCSRDTHYTNEFDLRTSGAALRRRGSVRELSICVVAYFQNVPFRK